MTFTRIAVLGAVAGLWLAGNAAYAGPTIDFSGLGGSNPQGSTLGPSVATGGITISGYVTNFSTPAPLWVRNDGLPEEGLGVCSEGTTNCSTGGGDQNELSNETNLEWIVLSRPANEAWLSLWVGSLDSGGTNLNETGTLYWSNTLGDLTTGHFSFASSDFSPNAYGNIEGLAQATAAGFNPFANFLMFRAGLPGEGTGNNNDYLVWGASLFSCEACGVNNIPTPEPITLSLFGAGLAGAVALRRRRRTDKVA